MQNIINVLKNWYPTSVLAEPEFRAQEAEYRRIEAHLAEVDQIIAKAVDNKTHLRAPNGNSTNLTAYQWALIRTKEFKEEFGDWERTAQIAKLLNSNPISSTGEEWIGKYELDRRSVRSYIANFLRRDEGYKNKDTGSIVKISKKKASKTASHGSEIHLKTVALIPQIIENAIYLGEEPNKKNKHGFTNFRYYAVGLKLGGVDYAVRLTTGVGDAETYYDHALTEIKKGELADRRGSLEGKAYDRRGPLSGHEDRRLLSLLQGDFSTFPNLVDENGEPKAAEVEAFERKHADIQLQQLTWIKRDGRAFGWFNPSTNTIVLCKGCAISTPLEAFWHATFRLTKTTAPRLYFKMLAFARKTPKSIKHVLKKFYPELKAGSEAWFDKLGAMRFVVEYADKIEESLNDEKSFFDNVLRVFSGDRVNLVGIGRRPPEKAVAALANAFVRGKQLG